MTNNTSSNNTTLAIFKSRAEAEAAIRELHAARFDVKKLSVVGRDYHTDERVIGYYNTADRMKYWGGMGAFWGWIWGLLFGSAVFMIPGFGPMIVAGPLVGWIVGALEGAVVTGGMSAIGAGLYSLGIPKDSVLNYETALKAGKYVLVAHGSPREASQAREIIGGTAAEAFEQISCCGRTSKQLPAPATETLASALSLVEKELSPTPVSLHEAPVSPI